MASLSGRSVTDTARGYDAIAKQYRDSKLLPFRHAIERFNDNPRNPPRPGVSLAAYGLERTCRHPPREGRPVGPTPILGVDGHVTSNATGSFHGS